MKKHRRRFKPLCLFSLLILFSFILTLSLIRSFSKSKKIVSTVPKSFDLSIWRLILVDKLGNQNLCDVPSEYRSIANAFCHAQRRPDCPQIPCTLISSSEEFDRDIYCRRGGKRANSSRFDWICHRSPALELFSHRDDKPSILAEAYTKLTNELYAEALSPFHDGETTKWGLILEGESMGYYPSIVENPRLVSLFDLTLGYDRRYFDLITDVHLTNYIDRIVSKRLSIEEISSKKNRSSILWINSNCETPSNRTELVQQLRNFISIDARGRCGNANWSSNDSPVQNGNLAKEKTRLSSEYLFTIAIENSLEFDYVTEKLWQPLAAGSVPIYLGAPNIDQWLPCENSSCIIHWRNFPSIKDLGEHLRFLLNNPNEYLKYHRWRNETKLRESFMKMINYFHESNQHSMECLLCDMMHRRDRGKLRKKLLAAKDPFQQDFPSLI